MTPTPITSQIFRDVMACHAAGVVLVTTNGAAGLAGLTATAFSTITDSPPTVMVALNRASHTFATLKANGRFAVNILSAQDQMLAQHFAQKSSPQEKFKDLAFETQYGQLLWPAAAAHLVCNLSLIEEIASHAVIFGEVIFANKTKKSALIYHQRDYGFIEKA